MVRTIAVVRGSGAQGRVISRRHHQRQAMDLLGAAGFADIDAPQPNFDGSWTSYVYSPTQRRKVRATVDLGGNISTRDDYR
jgi:hypothetical protein